MTQELSKISKNFKKYRLWFEEANGFDIISKYYRVGETRGRRRFVLSKLYNFGDNFDYLLFVEGKSVVKNKEKENIKIEVESSILIDMFPKGINLLSSELNKDFDLGELKSSEVFSMIKELSEYQEKLKNFQKMSLLKFGNKNFFMGETFTENEFEDLGKQKLLDQTINLANLSLMSFNKEAINVNLSLNIIYDEIKKLKNNGNSYFDQIVNIPGLSFNSWLNMIAKRNLSQIFDYYRNLFNTKIIDFEHTEFLSELILGTIENELDIIWYDSEEQYVFICFNKEYIYFKFKKETWLMHNEATLGFHVLKKYYNCSELCEVQKISGKQFLCADYSGDFSYTKSLFSELVEEIAAEYDISKERYIELIQYYNPLIYYNKDKECLTTICDINTDFSISKDVNGNNVVSRNVNIVDKEYGFEKGGIANLTCIEVNQLNRECLDKRFKLPQKDVQMSVFCFIGIEDPNMLEIKLNSKLAKNQIKKNAYKLLCTILYPEKKQLIIENDEFENDLSSKHTPCFDFKKIKNHLLSKNNKFIFHPTAEYQMDKQREDETVLKVLNRYKNRKGFEKIKFEISKKMDAKTLLKNREVYCSLIDKLRKNEKLSRDEMYFISMHFCYISSDSFSVSNIKLREILETINDMDDRSSQLFFLSLLDIRYGDYSTIICCIWFYLEHTRLTESANNFMNSIQWFRVKPQYWVDFFKKLSLQVKNDQNSGEFVFNTIDFKNMQYLEMMVGNLGSDGKCSKDIVGQRVYRQICKTVIDPSKVLITTSNVEGANNLCIKSLDLFWKMVLDKKGKSKSKIIGIKELIRNRESFATTKSSSSGKSAFGERDLLFTPSKDAEAYYNTYNKSIDTKSGVFNTERNEFFYRIVYDFPLTLCNMTLKPKEFAKMRYIYGVTLTHYIVNSITTFQFEKFFDNLGVNNTIIPELKFKNMLNVKKRNKFVYNCVDYSEFNDQHEEHHKAQVWKSFRKMVLRLGNLYSNELALMGLWMEYSCYNMLIRTGADSKVIFRHKGRLFSGERSTTLINSLMSVFYHSLITWNTENYLLSIGKSELSRDELISNISLDSGFSPKFLTMINDNECLGDDNICIQPSVYRCHLYNEIAVLSGLILKIEKCLVGVGFSEFLRVVSVHSNRHNVITKGYFVRAIVSLVAGNIEGEQDSYWQSKIKQIHDQLEVVYNRSNVVGFLNEIFENVFKKITKLRQKYKDILDLLTFAPQKLDIKYAYIKGKFGGMNLSIIGSNMMCDCKKMIPKMERPTQYSEIKELRLYSIEEQIKSIIAYYGKYGKPNAKKIAARIIREREMQVESHSTKSTKYTTEYLIDFHFKLIEINNIIKKSKMVTFNDYYGIDTDKVEKLVAKIDSIICPELLETPSIADCVKRCDAIKQNLELIDTKLSVKDVIEKELGSMAAITFMFVNQVEVCNLLQQYFEYGEFSLLLSFIFPKLTNGKNANTIAVAFQTWIRRNVISM